MEADEVNTIIKDLDLRESELLTELKEKYNLDDSQ